MNSFTRKDIVRGSHQADLSNVVNKSHAKTPQMKKVERSKIKNLSKLKLKSKALNKTQQIQRANKKSALLQLKLEKKKEKERNKKLTVNKEQEQSSILSKALDAVLSFVIGGSKQAINAQSKMANNLARNMVTDKDQEQGLMGRKTLGLKVTQSGLEMKFMNKEQSPISKLAGLAKDAAKAVSSLRKANMINKISEVKDSNSLSTGFRHNAIKGKGQNRGMISKK